jgi:hypothetical protein
MASDGLARVDRWLAEGPFGAIGGITKDLSNYYTGVVELCSEACGVPLPFPERVSNPLLSTLVRARVDQILRTLLRSETQGQAMALEVVQDLRASGDDASASDEAHGPVLLVDWHSRAARYVAEIVRAANEEPGNVMFRAPTAAQHRMYDAAQSVLKAAVPAITANTVPLVRVVTLVDGICVSGAYYGDTPWMAHINVSNCESVATLAGAVLHECLHEKFAALRTTRQLFTHDYADSFSPPVVLPWMLDGSRGAREFPVARAVATTHVYTHLAVLHTSLARMEPKDATKHLAAARSTYQRADYLLRALANKRQRAVLATDGSRLVDWLTRGLGLLTDAVPPDFVPAMYR